MFSFLDRFDTEDVLLRPRGRRGALLLLVMSMDALLLLVPASIAEELELVVVMLVSSSLGYLPSAVLGSR